MTLPKNIILKLVKLGYSQKDISTYTGVPQPTINKIIKGGTQNPRWRTVEALQSFLDTVKQFDDESV